MRKTPTDRRRVLQGIAGVGASLTFAGYAGASSGSGQYIVVARGNGITRKLEREGFGVTRELAGGDVLIVAGPADAENELERIGGVSDVSRNVRLRLERPEVTEPAEVSSSDTEDESYWPFQWDKQTTNVAEAHETTTGEGGTIAIIDTGTDLDHPDLEPNTDSGALFRRIAGRGGNVVDSLDDGLFSGATDVRVPTQPDLEPYEVTNDDEETVGYRPAGFDIKRRDASDDVHGHGSHVAGIAAATVGEDVSQGFTGIAGTAPDATIVPHRVFYWELQEITYVKDGTEQTDQLVVTSTTTADILGAIDYAANVVGVDAMNMSIGTPPLPPQLNSAGFRQAYRLVIQDAANAGSVVVVSAGNSGAELNKGGVFTVPNSVPGAMSISATGPNDELVFYSNSGANEIDVGAPGGGYETLEKTLVEEPGEVEWPFPTNLVLSTTPPDVFGAPYAYFAGTSMAAPQVTGAAALVAAVDGDLNTNQIESVITNNAKKATGRRRRDVGAGVLDVAGAVDGASNRR